MKCFSREDHVVNTMLNWEEVEERQRKEEQRKAEEAEERQREKEEWRKVEEQRKEEEEQKWSVMGQFLVLNQPLRETCRHHINYPHMS